MFTGIIESMGTVLSIRPFMKGYELTVDAHVDLSGDKVGDSIAVDGVCLTATAIEGTRFTATFSEETVSRTTLSGLKPGAKVNLERALTLSTRLGGHLVLGHVDTVGVIRSKGRTGESTRVTVQFEPKFSRYVIEKGSIAIDGISLTVNQVHSDAFEVNIIPHTALSVTLTLKGPGDRVNLEFDVIGKYVERLLKKDDNTDLESLLKKHGYM
ncbi:MAG TPA: riboflavin synthase [Deltaproteobacteria bacterium]|jgi:riboflavin synthase|nr:riboflavin synthase [Deltaproteobacteria bacterium]HOI07441.1 riboflavin synthase [Deltaproteobacteria bacterium]